MLPELIAQIQLRKIEILETLHLIFHYSKMYVLDKSKVMRYTAFEKKNYKDYIKTKNIEFFIQDLPTLTC